MEGCDQSRGVADGPGRLMAMVGLALLCISFLLPYPAIYAPLCIERPGSVSYVNYGPGVRTQERPGMSPAMVAFGEGHAVRYLLGPGFPFILGAAGLCLHLLPRLMRSDKARRRLARATCLTFAACLLWSAGVICLMLARFAKGLMIAAHYNGLMDLVGPDTSLTDLALPFAIFCVLILITGFGCAAMVFGRQDIRRPLGASICALISLPVFALHASMVTDVAHFGPFVSALACVLIVVGGLRETVAAARAPLT